MGAYRQPEIKEEKKMKENIEWGSSEYFPIFFGFGKELLSLE